MTSATALIPDEADTRRPARLGGLANLRRQRTDERPAPDERPEPSGHRPRGPAPLSPPVEEQELKGKVKRIIYQKVDDKGSFQVLLVEDGRNQHRLTTKFGYSPTLGDRIVARGTWGDYKGSPDFKASSVVLEMPNDLRGIAGWIETLPGIGKATVNKLVKNLGDELKDALADPDRLVEGGAKPAQAKLIVESWSTGTEMPEIIAFLKGLNLGEAMITKCIKQFGGRTKTLLSRNPWLGTMFIEGFGMLTADNFARRNGNDMRSPDRIKAALKYAMDEASQNGHCGLRPHEVRRAAAKLTSLEEEIIEPVLAAILNDKEKNLILDDQTGLAYTSGLYNAEINLAAALLALLDHEACDTETATRLIAEAEEALDLKLDPSQHAAAMLALTSCVCIITGGPGTGKSTTIRVVHHALDALKRDVVSCAPTGRAAKRISELTGKPASTLHRLLQAQGGEEGNFQYDADRPFTENWFVVDEFSMVDVKLAWSFIRAIKTGSGLTIVGDDDQLPSVGPGQVLRDLIESGAIPVARLQVVHRQTSGSGIVEAAHRINRGEHPNPPDEAKLQGFNIQRRDDPAQVVERMLWLMTSFLPAKEIDGRPIDVLRDVQVMTSIRGGDLGVAEVNRAIKGVLNPASDDGNSVTFNPDSSWVRTFTVGDRVMQTKNNYVKGVYNGEVGLVCWVGEREAKDGKRSPAFEVEYPGGKITYVRNEHDEVEHAYAITVHKSQGCEFPVVIFLCPSSHGFMLKRNLFYTAVTRAKRLCVVVGDDHGISHAVRTQDSNVRNTGLAHRLRGTAP